VRLCEASEQVTDFTASLAASQSHSPEFFDPPGVGGACGGGDFAAVCNAPAPSMRLRREIVCRRTGFVVSHPFAGKKAKGWGNLASGHARSSFPSMNRSAVGPKGGVDDYLRFLTGKSITISPLR
jgi:hypothetical protein